MKEKLVIDGNAFYEIDMECERCKRNQKDRQKRGKLKVESIPSSNLRLDM